MPVHVLVHIDATVERVFAAVTDHETFLRSDDGIRATVLRPGHTERNGLGCVREVHAGRARYVEEVTSWQPPRSFEYLIHETSLPLQHSGSRMAFTPNGSGTDVEWTSRFVVPVPVVGGALRWWMERRLTEAFTKFLLTTKTRLEQNPR